MNNDNCAQHATEVLFARILENPSVTGVATVIALLPEDPATLRALQLRCMRGGRVAGQNGHHQEVRRLWDLARELAKLADRKAGEGTQQCSAAGENAGAH